MTEKNILKYAFLLLLPFLAACGDDACGPADDTALNGTPLEISVQAGDFAADGQTDTRAVDNGAATSFEEGDRLGITILDADGGILADNVPYIYKEGNWVFDSANTENKTQCYYYSFATYLAYFPYDVKADGLTTVDDLKAKFVPLVDQSTKESYRASDLMTASGPVSGAPLQIKLTHAYASLSVAAKTEYSLCDVAKSKCYEYHPLSEVVCNIDKKYFKAYESPDGSYRCILPDGLEQAEIPCYYVYKSKTYRTIIKSDYFGANVRYVNELITDQIVYGLDDVKSGDLYCVGTEQEPYLIPLQANAITPEQRDACVGVVVKKGRDSSGDWIDDSRYESKNGEEMPTINAYVMAIRNAGIDGREQFPWSSEDHKERVDMPDMNRDQYKGFHGYKNTHAIINFCAVKNWELSTAFPAISQAAEAYDKAHPAPASSSGWFLPSAGQCWYWFQNKKAILEYIRHARGESDYNWDKYYWSSSEAGDSHAWCIDFPWKRINNGDKY